MTISNNCLSQQYQASLPNINCFNFNTNEKSQLRLDRVLPEIFSNIILSLGVKGVGRTISLSKNFQAKSTTVLINWINAGNALAWFKKFGMPEKQLKEFLSRSDVRERIFYLNLGCCKNPWGFIEGCPNIKHLQLQLCNTTVKELQKIVQAKFSLKSFQFSTSIYQLTDLEYFSLFKELLEDNPGLYSLDIHSIVIGTAGIELLLNAIESMSQLRELDLAKTRLGEDFSHLDESQRKRALAIIERFTKIVQGKTELQSLNLSHNGLDEPSVEFVAQALEKNDTLLKLDLSYNPFTNKGMEALATGIKKVPLKELLLRAITNEGVSLLPVLKILVDFSQLTTLNLSNNQVGFRKEEGLKVSEQALTLAKVLKSLVALTHLDISYCEIDLAGIKAISKSLKNGVANLKILKVRNNTFGAKGAAHLLNALCSHSLENLDIAFNHLQDKGVKALIGYLNIMPRTLKILDISGLYPMEILPQDQVIEQLANDIQKHNELRQFVCSHNNLSKKQGMMLIKASQQLPYCHALISDGR